MGRSLKSNYTRLYRAAKLCSVIYYFIGIVNLILDQFSLDYCACMYHTGVIEKAYMQKDYRVLRRCGTKAFSFLFGKTGLARICSLVSAYVVTAPVAHLLPSEQNW